MPDRTASLPHWFGILALTTALSPAPGLTQEIEPILNHSTLIHPGALPYRVHVFEDFETEIEKRWWLRGTPETNNLPPSLSTSRPNTRALRASPSRNFDEKMGDPDRDYNAVVFNPVPGPPMGENTRLAFRFWVKGTDRLRVQIYSLSRGYHRLLTLTGLTQGSWQNAAVDMSRVRRPDGSGGVLSKDERIDDIQFYVPPGAELVIDDIVLYEPAPFGETRPFPNRILFTGWFDTGNQGQEWPGTFRIVEHQPPLTWDAASSVPDPATGRNHIRIGLRGERPLSGTTRLRFRHRLSSAGSIDLTLANPASGQSWNQTVTNLAGQRWDEAAVDFLVPEEGARATELRFDVPGSTELLVDDVLLFEPGRTDHTARLETSLISLVIADNEGYGPLHRPGYNGVSQLTTPDAPDVNLFVPSYAGLNFEHIFSGDAASFGWNIFEPRKAPMLLLRPSPGEAVLFQERTENWPLRSQFRFEAVADAVDFSFCATPLEDAWARHGYIGVFFASYIQAPEDLAIEFIGRSRPGRGNPAPRWIKHLPPSHGVAASHRPAGSEWDPPVDDGFKISLASGFSDYEYLHPFYFGRSGGKMLLMMFRRPGAGGELRFAQSPSGGGAGNPAWDFLHLQRDYAVGREFCFSGRAVWRDFVSREEATRIYEEWSGEEVTIP